MHASLVFRRASVRSPGLAWPSSPGRGVDTDGRRKRERAQLTVLKLVDDRDQILLHLAKCGGWVGGEAELRAGTLAELELVPKEDDASGGSRRPDQAQRVEEQDSTRALGSARTGSTAWLSPQPQWMRFLRRSTRSSEC